MASAPAAPSGATQATGTRTQRVYEAIRDRLIKGDFKPGAFIREAEIGELMGVSRTPVREALNRLASEGFVRRLPRRGFRVPDQSIDDLVHLYPVLSALEVLAGELAFPRLTETLLRQLEETNQRFAEAVAANDVAEAVEWNDKFHHHLSEMSGNHILCNLLDDLRSQVRRLEVWEFTKRLLESEDGDDRHDEWVRQHDAILRAARRRDYDSARMLLRENRSLVFAEAMKRLPARTAPGMSDA